LQHGASWKCDYDFRAMCGLRSRAINIFSQPAEETPMGYGNPLFDGDEPLPAPDAAQRIVSMRLLFRGLRARVGDPGARAADGHDDAAARRQRGEDHSDRSSHG
jgi:hypothetical protein